MSKAELALRTLTLKPSSKRRKALGKHSARQTPTSEHKSMFAEALDRAKEGNLPLDLIHFYKYLQVRDCIGYAETIIITKMAMAGLYETKTK